MKKEIKQILEKLDFVNWDRFIDVGNEINFYGWIERKDTYRDFVVIAYAKDEKRFWYFITSSAKRHDEIAEVLGMIKDSKKCKRVEDNFDIKNCIKINNEQRK